MFDMKLPEFPFDDSQSFFEFILYSESGKDSSKWGTDHKHIGN